ncbi:type II CAAX endopeptidase family protein [Staphylococcus sp. NRL 16/872]|uniref:CPBP family intramembrane glutamic endopeptidase n=1 Tax=Staphylococcus sp. NRL 16/872 TaxID=2930131 RepID=UPI001FB548BC|nr:MULTISPECIES: type II CAAX endopeptidase family protein [unclassified Staphylococcus]MCJ1655362.1 CPBP family intramembrane metalloprotease [Staphylococcus sp. NRL 21/187]MCJ1661198.1 CPBP family intramembrane metalloprotease [Staphylococcus sp. NRL 18/288]MCJ1667087.1 CPBP family intramembrane metalloprotease [Staphylococcus sp. NRL 19/737]WEN69565.1 type II CAAX endopeptidase family protein [Staphylococcus sp. NRL 16/872]
MTEHENVNTYASSTSTSEQPNQHETPQHHEERHPTGNTFVNILIFIGWLLLAQIPVVLMIYIMGLSAHMDLITGTLASLLFLLFTGVIIWLVRRYYKSHTYEQPKKFTKKDVAINIGWAILLRIIVIGMSQLMFVVTGSRQTQNDKMLLGDMNGQANMEQLPQVFPLIVFALTISFIAPYLEELIYRGIFKETLFKRSRFWLPFIISSIIFASQHGTTNWVAALMYLMMGMIFYLAYHRRGNVRDSMMVHMIHNGVTGVIIIIGYFAALFLGHIFT